jgi:1-pyrroline-5-carboxylate dehydrogenase
MSGLFRVPEAKNEPVLSYAPGSPEREELKKRLEDMSRETVEVPLIIGGKEVKTGSLGQCVSPHKHSRVLCKYHKASAEEVNAAVDAAVKARAEWSETPWHERAAVFLKAAEMISGPYRQVMNAATMLGQSKTPHQSEIDAVCELIDFYRFDAQFLTDIYARQPQSAKGIWDRQEYRALEGFVFAVTPFNFTSIAGNLPVAPAMAGCGVLWKPASSAVYSAYYIMKILREAGLPDGVINFVPGSGSQVGTPAITHEHLAGIHFTGSTPTFQRMWKMVAENIQSYKSYPRIVGETGGKDFVFAHESADVEQLVCALVRGAFEYQGQKCSAASRAYIPKSLWPRVKERLAEDVGAIKVGDVADFTTFMGAVIDEAAFDSIVAYIEHAKKASDAEIIIGGEYDKSEGYFIKPTVILTNDPHYKSMQEEIFGPVLTIYVYPDEEFEKTLDICNDTSPYALTGAIFARDRHVLAFASKKLRDAAGNFYYNDKPTGAVVGQQPFGGARASGTNDKAGTDLNMMRWLSPRCIKENLNPPTDFRYPYMREE